LENESTGSTDPVSDLVSPKLALIEIAAGRSPTKWAAPLL